MDAAQLKNVALFAGLTPTQLAKVASITQLRSYERGEFLFREGDPGREMFVLIAGKVRIAKSVRGAGEETLAVLEPGTYFGEMAVIEDSPRSADAIALASCSVWVIQRLKLEQVMSSDKELAYVLLWTFVRTLSERLRDTNEKLKGPLAPSRF